MIISHRYKFIFIKTHKTAGSSMEMALGPLCGPEDIITSMETNEGTGIPRNYFEDTLIGRAYAKSRLFRKCVSRQSPLLGAWYWEHMPATRVRELIGEEIWNSYSQVLLRAQSVGKGGFLLQLEKIRPGEGDPAVQGIRPHQIPPAAARWRPLLRRRRLHDGRGA